MPPTKGPARSAARVAATTKLAVTAIFKTSDLQADSLITRVAALHSYEVPAIAVWPIEKLLADYADWVEESVR